MNEKKRNISIDILKCLAAILITNSHMDLLYVKYNALATGGAIGDVLFFFCSGFTLFLGRQGKFDNWYKRRINRIYPTIFAWAILGCFVFRYQNDMKYILIHGGGWFVTCIMIYYVILYFIRRYAINRLGMVMTVTGVACVIWYLLMERPEGYNMYGETYFKWGHYFLFMLLGAMMGLRQQIIPRDVKGLSSLGMLAVSVIVYYAVLFSGRKWEVMEELQILSLLPLLAVTYYFYKVCNCDFAYRCYHSKVLGWCVKFVGGLCLEIYLVQASLFTDKMNAIFPLNLLIMFVIIVVMAYILRCLSRAFSQTFKDMDYNWGEVFKMV